MYQRWRSITGNKYGITYISACIYDSNKIPTAIRIVVGNLLAACVQAEINVVSYLLYTISDFSLTLTSSCTNIRPTMLLDVKDMRIPLKFHIYVHIPSTMSGLSVSDFTSAIPISGLTRIELCTGQCCYQQRWLRHPQKQAQQRSICFQRWFTPFDAMVTKFITFSPKNHPPHLHFRWCNLIPGWTILKSQRHSITLWWL